MSTTADEIMKSNDFKRCADFHGHICPGLSIGFKAARAGMARLRENRAEDEEMVAIVETDACCVDAVQALTGCTFGKGNFIYKDHGKMVFTFFSRNSGSGVRISMRPGAFPPESEHSALLEKIMAETADDQERERFQALHHQRARSILEMDTEELFVIETAQVAMPPKAVMQPSELCAKCGEPTMPIKMEAVGGKLLCRDCCARSDHPLMDNL